MVLRSKCGDILTIIQLERNHKFVIEFHSSVDPAWSWIHRECWTRDVISAVMTWKQMKIRDNYFDDGWFEY